MKKKFNKKKGILFWITGLSGSGKTSLGKKIFSYIKNNFGATILISGDDIRKIFGLKKYDPKSRIKYLGYYTKFCKKITDQGTNVIICVVGLSNVVRSNNRKTFPNYVEIFVSSNVHLIKKFNKKKVYKLKKNIWGVDIKPEFPRRPHITIKNDFSKSLAGLSKELESKIKKIYL
ncbi:MAG: hypothetical protein CMF94_05500 [Candidatus Marinimicrobia bacterium]|nr:hypothetical protein [Candidatus Neomarinimicrobiota bacterium]|tara:strand:- start:87 stop:611 length:525 start_codon:yes stop_codon:yes gene_type:complete